jgi:5'-nucleotidase
VTRDVEPNARVQALVDEYKELALPIAQQVYGTASHDILRAANAAGESALGNLIADSQLAATSSPETGGAQIAFMNPGGIRADLLAGDITYEELFTVQPFANTLTVKTFTGEQIRRLLEQQFDNPATGQTRILQVSEGFAYTYDLSRPAGSRVSNITLDGAPLDPTGSYRVTMNSFLATGGDNFGVFNEGTNVLGGPVDLDALAEYIQAAGSIAPAPLGRITRVP